MTDQAKARIEGVRTVGIPVSDQDRALQFYVETLGFDKLMDEPLEQLGGRWIEVSPPRSTITIALTPARAEAPTADAAALRTQLSASAVDVDELLRWEGIPPMFDFRDPDGNTLYVSESPS